MGWSCWPNNVRLTDAGIAKLIDFGGLAPFGASDLVVGTTPFLAPENLRGERLDPRTDLFSLGVLAYWLLTEQLPFHARRMEELPVAWQWPVKPPSQLAAGVPQALDELVLSLLATEPDARPLSAPHVIAQLSAIAGLERESHEHEVVASYLHHPPLQGRDAALKLLTGQLDALSEGRGGVLEIEATPGLGRSALLAPLATSAQLRGHTVLRVHASLHPGNLGVASELARIALGMFPDLKGEGLAVRCRAARDDDEGAHSAVSIVERDADTSNAIRALLCTLSERNSLVIVVDDLQLCDAASLALLSSLCGELADRPMLLAVTRLAGDPQQLAGRPLEAAAKRLSLGPLEPAEIAALVKALFGAQVSADAFAEALHRRTGGNPGHCMDVIRAALASGLLTYAGGVFALPRALDASALPTVGRALERARLDFADHDQRELVELLSVSGRPLTIRELCAASVLPTATVLQKLNWLAQTRVILRAGDQVALASSELAGEVERTIPVARKRALHVRLAELLCAQPTGNLATTLEAGAHLMHAGEAHELRGAHLIAASVEDQLHGVSAMRSFIPALERALEVLTRYRAPEQSRLALLIPLSVAGVFCAYPLQRRYLQPTLRALARRTGIALAIRLRPLLGVRAALWLGLLWGSLRAAVCADGRSLRRDMEGYLAVLASACGATANASDTADAEELQRWLAPFAGAVYRPLQLVYRFCSASLDVVRGRSVRASALYEQVLAETSSAAPGLDERFREQLRLGALYGLAHLALERNPSHAQRYADELESSSVFYAPHAAAVRMGCALYRGDAARASELQARAEVLALRPGLVWTAYTGLMLRCIHGMATIDDAVAIARIVDESRSLANISPEAGQYLQVACAHLQTLRGRAREAARVLSETIEKIHPEALSLRLLAAVAWARALREAGEAGAAVRVCERHQALVPNQELEQPMLSGMLFQECALARAAIGDAPAAALMLDRRLAAVEAHGTPLLCGALHRDRASVALQMDDRLLFQYHPRQMLEHYRKTMNPLLMGQHSSLLARATRASPPPSPVTTLRKSSEWATVYRIVRG